MSPMMGGMGAMGGMSNDSYSNSLRGLSGLSGLDRDSMIKTMTLRSRSRIAKYKQKLQSMTWKQEAMQNISDKLIELSRKYLNVTSENSLIRESTFNNYKVESSGEFKDKITAMGSPKALKGINILGVSNKASDTTYVTDKANGNGGITTPEIDLTKPVNFGALEGKTLDIRMGNKDQAKDYEIKFAQGNYDVYKRDADNKIMKDSDGNPIIDEDKKKKVIELFRKSFKGTPVNFGSNQYTMDDVLDVDFEVNKSTKKIEVRIKTKSPLGTLNSTYVTGGSALKELGMNPVGNTAFDLNSGTKKGFMLTGSAEALIGGYTSAGVVKNSGSEILAKGGSMVFELNGVKKTITFPSDIVPSSNPAELNVKKDGITYNLKNLDDVVKYLNQELKSAYGKDAVTVTKSSDNKLTFNTQNGARLKISDGGGHLVGEENVFKIPDKVSNRLDLNTNLRNPEGNYKSDLIKKLDQYASTQGSSSFAELLKNKPKLEFNINGNKIEVKTKNINTLSDLIDGLNDPKNITQRGMTNGEYNSIFKIGYDSVRDSFVFKSTDKGSGTVMDGQGLWQANPNSLESALFGTYQGGNLSKGKDATVFYKTADNPNVQSMVVRENEFTINDAKFNIKDGFNVKKNASGNFEVIDQNKSVSFRSKVEADKLVETVKNLIKDYNDLVKLMGKQFKTMAERKSSGSGLKYEPLTEEQRNKMSEKEIERWEEKAKEGLLFGNTHLRGARDDLAGIVYYTKNAVAALRKIGITQSSYTTDPNATLEFDEAKFRAALAEDPESVKKLFLGDGQGNVGFSNHLKNVIARHASDTGSYKGNLVEEAGSKYAPRNAFTNRMFKEIDSLKKTIDFYEKRLKREEDRYIKRFSHLEKLMKKAEMQSGYLMNLQGY